MNKIIFDAEGKKIVVLDGHLLNPGDLSWKELAALGICDIYARTPPNLIVKRCEGAQIVLTNKVPFTKQTIAQLPSLKYIGVTATGYNIIDLKAAKDRGVVVTNVPGYSTAAVAQHTFALLMHIASSIELHHRAVEKGEWSQSSDFCFWKKSPIDLAGLTLGIVGFGTIGQNVAQIGLCFGMNVIVHTRTPSGQPGVAMTDLEHLFRNSDVITLHCPLTRETEDLINRSSLEWMKPNAILLNTSRGGLIDEDALAAALREKRILAAGLDVLKQEPPDADCPLVGLENCIITPHIAWASPRSRARLLAAVIKNLQSYLAGRPQNIVN